jgi:hypothetical protein
MNNKTKMKKKKRAEGNFPWCLRAGVRPQVEYAARILNSESCSYWGSLSPGWAF